MISTNPNIHIQPMFHPYIPYPSIGLPPELLFENRGHGQTHFFGSAAIPLSFLVVALVFLCISIGSGIMAMRSVIVCM